jgi:hypothetical protein
MEQFPDELQRRAIGGLAGTAVGGDLADRILAVVLGARR